MAVYKVPQDVEADDKLIGPFSFRQFVYLIIVALAIAAAWALGQLFLPLIAIPLPVILLFGALALPLRKDQPMEIYMAAIVSFYLKPRRRLWKPDGITSLIEITVPKTVEVQRTKDLSQSEASQRLSYLANVVDSQGWAVRGVGAPTPNSPMNVDAYYAAQQTEDILDNNAPVSQNFDHMIDEADNRRRQEMIDRMHQAPSEPAAVPITPTPQITNPYDTFLAQQAAPAQPAEDTFVAMPAPQAPQVAADDTSIHFDPYPADIRQTVIRPLAEQPIKPQTPAKTVSPAPSAPSTSVKPVSPDIINLANQHDLSIETIAREANRIKQKEKELSEDEVVISLR
ncbi:PrgI family protein [compost metagenome]